MDSKTIKMMMKRRTPKKVDKSTNIQAPRQLMMKKTIRMKKMMKTTTKKWMIRSETVTIQKFPHNNRHQMTLMTIYDDCRPCMIRFFIKKP